MTVLSNTIDALLKGRSITMAWGVYFDFATTPLRVWTGFGRRKSGDGSVADPYYEWQGLGGLGSIDGLQFTSDIPTEQITFRLSGLENFLPGNAAGVRNVVRNAVTECIGRKVNLYLLVFDPSADHMRPIDPPVVLRTCIMGAPFLDIDLRREGGTHIVEMPAEPRTIDKWRSAWEMLTDYHHQQRWTGDTGLDRLAWYDGKSSPVW